MRVVNLVTASVLILVAAAGGQGAFSVAIAKDQSRIEAGAGGNAPTYTPADEWTVTTETSAIDDTTNVFATAYAEKKIFDKYGKDYTVTVQVACREKKTDFFIVFGGMMVADSRSWGDVTLRLDKEKARVISMNRSTDYRALGLWNGSGIRLLKSMIGKKNLLIVATPYNESNVETTVSLHGFDAALSQVRNACEW